jgi:hypothetical protein
MPPLSEIRSALLKEQRDIISAIWTYFRQDNQSIPVRVLHQSHGGKPKVQASLDQLGGSIVFEYKEGGVKYYHLTFLGTLLTQEGPGLEILLSRFLSYVVDICAAEPLRTHVSSHEVARQLRLDQGTSYLLGYLVRESPLSGSGSFSAHEWNVEVPDNVEDLPSDLELYIQTRAIESYDPLIPVDQEERSSYLWSQRGTSTGLLPPSTKITNITPPQFVDQARLEELQSIKSDQYDLTRVIQLCTELNFCNAHECHLAITMLTRALIDHVPLIFNAKSFSEVANNYSGPKSFKESMNHLEHSCRKIADSHLHVQIRAKEVLPNKTQVNFSNYLDVLLAEIVRLLR